MVPGETGVPRVVEAGALRALPWLARTVLAGQPAQPLRLIADERTWTAAGRAAAAVLQEAGVPQLPPFLLRGASLAAEWSHVETLAALLGAAPAHPVAVGAGTLNDLVKLAAHRVGRPYLAVATAASMDGYAAAGASILREGTKDTHPCPPPAAVVADLDILRAAPPALHAAGYGDLAAKLTAGADWLLAEALGEEPLHPVAWRLVQEPLPAALGDPDGVRAGDAGALRRQVECLLACGEAMSLAGSSRPASGAEHQLSHLWDMERAARRGPAAPGAAPLHGHQVAVATLEILRLYARLLARPLQEGVGEDRAAEWREWPEEQAEVEALFPGEAQAALRRKAREESRAKHPTREALREQLRRLQARWPALAPRLREQLPSPEQLAGQLRRAGAPTRPEELGLEASTLPGACRRALALRRRFTVLDLAYRALEPEVRGW